MNADRNRSHLGAFVLWGALILVIIMIVAISIALKFRKTNENETPPEKKMAVNVLVLRNKDIPDTIVLPGRIEPFAKADVAVEKPGKIVSIEVDKGDHVDAGTILMQVDNDLWKVIQKQMEIELADAERNFVRWQKLKKAGDVSGSEFDRITTRRDRALIALEEAKIHVGKCLIKTPISGVVDARYVELGEYGSEGQPTFRIVNTDKLKVVINVPEQDIVNMAEGSPISFTVAALAGNSFTGHVSFISIEGSRKSNSFKTEIIVHNPGSELRPGMIVDVTLSRGIKKACVAVPLAAVIPKRGEDVVYVVSEGTAIKRIVRIDSIIGHLAILSSGVTPGEKLVIEGHRTLQDGMPVKIMN